MSKIINYGQVFTPRHIVEIMLNMRKNTGRTLEPACGDGAFSDLIDCRRCLTAIEIDSSTAPEYAVNMNFFDYPLSEKFDCIIGNPPYVKYQDITEETKAKLNLSMFGERTNLYLFFIEKCIRHLNYRGELIFITPRDFLKATSAIKMNNFLYSSGTITDFIDLGDERIFGKYAPNCIIWRFEKDNFSRICNDKTGGANKRKYFLNTEGQLLISELNYSKKFRDYFYVKVGAVSGMDKAFINEKTGNMEFVYSQTYSTGKTRKMLYNLYHQNLEQFKEELLKRGIKKFDESNWWKWGRGLFQSEDKRIYVNCKTRAKAPFFIHKCNNYDGSVLGIFPIDKNAEIELLCEKLNAINWNELGFMCADRYIFSQKSLQNTVLPDNF